MLDGLPARDHCGGSDPRKGEGRWWILACTTSPCPVPHQRSKTGGCSLHFLPLLCGVTPRRARRGQLKPAPRYALPQRIRGIRANSLPMRIPGHSLDHNGEGSALWERSVGVVKSVRHLMRHLMRHPPFVTVSPIRRHVLDPQRRKSSIDPRPLGIGFSCSHWRIFFTTALKQPWRSRVSQSASAMACRSPAASVFPAARSRVVQDWRRRRVRSRCCGSHATANTLTLRLALQPAG